jgi:hypothetical protein
VNRVLFVLICLIFQVGCTVPCGNDDPAIDELQRIPDSYYANLFREVEAIDCKSNCRLPLLDKLRNLGNRTIYLRKFGTEGSALLKYCFDEGLTLKFKGLRSGSGEIWIKWGGSTPGNGEALLWSQSVSGRADA